MEYLLHFGFTSDRLSPMELRDLVEWTVKPQLLAVPGVAQAQILGGEVRERQILVDPARLAGNDLSLDDVVNAAARATAVVGGGFIETDSQRLVIRARPAAQSAEDLSAALISYRSGLPVRLGDVAAIRDGAEPRFGDALIDGQPGILVETSTQFGANTLQVTRALEQRLDALSSELTRQGVRYHAGLLRPASFIESAIEKLRNSLLIGAALVIALLLVALRDWRGALVSFAAIPLTLLTTVWILDTFGFTLNTMTLGGLVVALGVVVDDAVIDVENILRRRRTAVRTTNPYPLFAGASLEVRRPVSPGVLRHRCRGGRLPADPDAVGASGVILPPLIDCLHAGSGTFTSGGHERDPGVVHARDGTARTEAGSCLAEAPEGSSAAPDRMFIRQATCARDLAGRQRCCGRDMPATAGSAPVARLPGGLSDRACLAAPGSVDPRGRPCRTAHQR
jgi:hypothetical protein